MGRTQRFSLIETRETDAGVGPPLHVHRDAAESFYVLAGAYRMHVDGEDFVCPVGSFVYVPAGAIHTFASLDPRQPQAQPVHAVGDGRLLR